MKAVEYWFYVYVEFLTAAFRGVRIKAAAPDRSADNRIIGGY